MSAPKFDQEWRDRTEESRQTYRERRTGERPARQRRKFLIPDGPWLNEKGQLRDDFMNWCLDQWVAKFKIAPDSGRSRDDVAGDVFKYFVNDPARLDERWACYCQECSRHIENSMLLLENDQLKQQDKDRFVRAAIALKANAEDPDADETDPVHLQAIALVTRINQVSPKILGGESEAIVHPESLDGWGNWQESDKAEASRREVLQRYEEWERALTPYPAPITTVDISTAETPAPQRIEPTVLPQSETQSTASVNPKIARIMDAVRLKAKSTPQTAVPESESVSTSPAPLDLSLSPEQMASNRDRL
ncbi:MAG: hypothetical protein ACRC8Y_12930, partial [Chroococcales cyanobacterium]